MKQIVQSYKTGDLWLEDVPLPLCRSGGVLVKNDFSVVSIGTERMKVAQARMSLIEKAKARPDQVMKVLQNVRQVGLSETYKKVQERLDALTPLGYSSVGRIVAVGDGIDSLSIGDRVACAGEGIACHAEYISVPKNLCAVVPESVNSKDAAFSTVGAIAMNGVRQAEVSLGDTVLVIGLGLVGLLGIQILRAAGCRVIGVDIAQDKLELAKTCGAEATFGRNDPNLTEAIAQLTKGRGVDSVYISASTKSSDPMDLAGEVARDRAKVVIVGMVPVEADWRTYYAKELTIVMSRSYGPGRYDRSYEMRGVDYPIGYVPWTLRRNLEEFMRLIGDGLVSPALLGPSEFEFEEANSAYSKIHEAPDKYGAGVIFRYSDQSNDQRKIFRKDTTDRTAKSPEMVFIGMIGAGNFSTGTLIPAIKSAGTAELVGICSAGGLSAKSATNRHGFTYATSNINDILEDENINAVIIATRHDTHAEFASKALRANKNVFVEKPLAMSIDELSMVAEANSTSDAFVMPGFNRRFSPLAKGVKDFFPVEIGPVEINCRINAGAIDADSWYQDPQEGGWRIVSEGCHFVDLIAYLGGGLPKAVSAIMVGGDVDGGQNDNCIATIELDNGSIGVLMYVANGDANFSKERIEVFGQDKVAVIDNWREARLHAGGKTKKLKPHGTGKGHSLEMQEFIDAVKTGSEPPISTESSLMVSLAMLKIQESLLDGGERKTVEWPTTIHEGESTDAK